jgi:hypothetical protein
MAAEKILNPDYKKIAQNMGKKGENNEGMPPPSRNFILDT